MKLSCHPPTTLLNIKYLPVDEAIDAYDVNLPHTGVHQGNCDLRAADPYLRQLSTRLGYLCIRKPVA